MNPFKYYLCRSDKNTKQRHIETSHGTNSGDVLFAKIDQFEAKEGLHFYKMACEKKESKDKPTTKLSASSGLSPDCDSETEENPLEDNFLANLKSLKRSKTNVQTTVQSK